MHVFFTTDVPQITTLSVVERCVSYLYITWNDTSQCVPVSYTVTLSNTSSGELLHNGTASSKYYNFTGLTSDMTYNITVTGRNRVGEDVVMNHTSSLKSDGEMLSLLHIIITRRNNHYIKCNQACDKRACEYNMSLNEFYLSTGIQLLHSVVRILMPDQLYKMFENFITII